MFWQVEILNINWITIESDIYSIVKGLNEIKIGVKYLYKGKELKSIPSSLYIFDDIEVVYETMPGWKEDISSISNFNDLPINCKNYIFRIEQLVGKRIRYIGIGPRRNDIIDRGEDL